MYNYDRKFYIGLSDATGFHKDIIEKVHRLIMILKFANSNSFLRKRLHYIIGWQLGIFMIFITSANISLYPRANMIYIAGV